ATGQFADALVVLLRRLLFVQRSPPALRGKDAILRDAPTLDGGRQRLVVGRSEMHVDAEQAHRTLRNSALKGVMTSESIAHAPGLAATSATRKPANTLTPWRKSASASRAGTTHPGEGT